MSSKNKSRCFADGGIVGSDGMTDAQREKKNAVLRSLGMSTSAPAPEPAPQPVAQPIQQQPQSRGLVGDALNLFSNRQKQIDKAAGYANGGLIGNAAQYWQDDNAKFEQASPNIGQRILRGINPITGFGSAMGAMKSAAEQGSIPGMGMALIQAIPAAGMIRAVPAVGAVKASVVPSVARTAVATGGGATANAIADDVQQRTAYRNGGKIKGSGTPTSDSIDAQVNETGEPIKVSTKERIVSHEQDQLLQRLAKAMGFESVDAFFEAGTGKPVGPTIKGGKRAAANGDDLKPWYMKDPATAIASGINSSMNASESANDSLKKLYPAGTFDAPQNSTQSQPSAQSASPLVSGALVNQPFAPEKERFPVGTPSKFITGNSGAMPDSSGGGFVSGNKPYTVNPTSQDGISKVTAQGTSPLYTNINPEQGIAGLKNQSIGQPADQEAQGLSRIASANKIRGEMIANRDKDIPAGGYGPGILGDGGIAADNAEKTQRWRNDELLAQAKNGNQAAIAALFNADAHRDVAAMGNETQRQNAGIAERSATNRDQVTMRGQDLQAANEAMRISGNPLDNKIKALSLNQASGIADLQNRAIGGDAKALEMLRSLNGKSSEHIRTNVVGGGTNELGQAQPQYLAVTGPDGQTRFVTPNGKQDGANVSAQNIRAEMQAGRISREDAIKQLKAIGYQ